MRLFVDSRDLSRVPSLSIVPASARGDIAKGLESPFVSKDLFTPVSNLIMQQIRPLIPYFQKYAGASIYRSTLGTISNPHLYFASFS